MIYGHKEESNIIGARFLPNAANTHIHNTNTDTYTHNS